MRRALLAAALLAAPAALAQDATTPGPDGAEAVVRTYIDAFASGDWTGAVGQMDPAEVAEFADLLGQMGAFAPDGAPKDKSDPVATVAGFFEMSMGAVSLLSESMESLDASVLGTVLEGDSLAHVVARSSFTMLGGPASGVEVTTARWTGRRWVVTFGGKLATMRQAIEMGAAMREELDDLGDG